MRTAPRAPGERKWWNARAFGILHRRPGPPPRFEEEIMERPIPLRERPIDIALVGFFLLNFFFITYIVDIEQITLPSTAPGWEYPLWPPKPFVDLIHWYGNGFDPVLMARPPWWKATIWIDALFFGPFYAFAIHAFVKGKNWIRIPTFLWAATLMTNVTVIMSEEMYGPHATPHRALVWALNIPWLLFPTIAIVRMWRSEKPFTRVVAEDDAVATTNAGLAE